MPEYLTQAIDSPAAWKALPINTAANTLIHLNSQPIGELRQSADQPSIALALDPSWN